MLRILTATSILALAAVPALAQEADPVAPTTSEAPVSEEPATIDATVEQPAPAEPAAAPAAIAPSDKAALAAQLVEAEFSSYDADGNGELSQAEFSQWMLALQTKAEAKGIANVQTDAQKTAWAQQAFLTADKDKSTKVSKAEVTTYLQG